MYRLAVSLDNTDVSEVCTVSIFALMMEAVGLNLLLDSVLALGTKVRGFKSVRGRWFLMATKIRSTTSFGGGSKAVSSMS
jgi:hypothetical protein